MRESTTTSSVLISLCLLLCLSCSSLRQTGNNTPMANLLHTGQISKYQVRIHTPHAEITGILILKHTNQEWRGSLMNEFGIKAFDFIASPENCRLQNTASFLDKWYIRKTIEGDLAFLFWKAPKGIKAKGKLVEVLSDDSFELKNTRHHINYLFQPIAP
jgi:hypothetical protein